MPLLKDLVPDSDELCITSVPNGSKAPAESQVRGLWIGSGISESVRPRDGVMLFIPMCSERRRLQRHYMASDLVSKRCVVYRSSVLPPPGSSVLHQVLVSLSVFNSTTASGNISSTSQRQSISSINLYDPLHFANSDDLSYTVGP
jgi:hypothetical protein